jgi:hypothetical protein
MSGTPAHHKQPKLDRVLAAHKRRARLIAQLHEQAIAAANDDLSAAQNTIKTGTTRHSWWSNAAWVSATALLKVVAVAILVAGLGCILLAFLL